MKTLISSALAAVLSTAAFAADLKITDYNPGENGLFAVSSSLIEGPSEVILVDAQFERDDAEDLVEMIQATGKTLTTVFISHKDPDFYFGVDRIRESFPDVKILATPATVEGITKTIELKNEFWGPILGENAPRQLIVPEVLHGGTLMVDGEPVQVVGLDGHDPAHTFLWVPSARTVLGGVPVYENVHVWMADNQTPESREKWRKTLDQILALNPERIVPGHYMGEAAKDASSVAFTRGYIAEFEAASENLEGSAAVISAMVAAHPDFTNTGDLELSAQVLEGERSWP